MSDRRLAVASSAVIFRSDLSLSENASSFVSVCRSLRVLSGLRSSFRLAMYRSTSVPMVALCRSGTRPTAGSLTYRRSSSDESQREVSSVGECPCSAAAARSSTRTLNASA
ncbi:MAG: hypothetical protein ACK54T_07325 [bacterium]